jgi:hypothetical protein
MFPLKSFAVFMTCAMTVSLCLREVAAETVTGQPLPSNAIPGLYTPPPERPSDAPAPPEVLSGRTSSAGGPVIFGEHTSIQVNVDGLGNNIVGDAANEPSMAINPLNPKQIGIGWRQFDSVTSNFREGGYGFSTNGGQSWTFGGVLEEGVFRSDPVLAADGFGNLYYSSLRHPAANPDGFEVTVFKSTNGGASWPTSAYAYGGDKQWMAVDERTTGIGAGHLYQNWSTSFSCCGPVDFTRSINGGAFFQPPLSLPYPYTFWGTLDTDPNGTLYIGGREYYGVAHTVMRSLNAKDPGVTPVFEQPVSVYMEGFTSGFGGFDGPNPAGLLGQVWIATHPTKLGHVYMLGSVVRSKDPSDVMFVRSIDGGLTWSEPVRVNDDPFLGTAWQWFGAMSVAPNGRIDATWNDTRTTGDAKQSAVFYSYSLDEGQTWSVNEQVSTVFNSHLGWPNQSKMGDYSHMISDNGGANLAYAATFNGEQDVYFLRIRQDCNSNGIDDDCDITCGAAGTRCNVAGCGLSPDCNGNRIPDICEPNENCNQNGLRDLCEIGSNPSLDCNSNRRIDSCESPNDCNVNGLPDVCDLFAHGDCNGNATPDDCDAGTTSSDRNGDDVPDECQGSCCQCGPCDDLSEVECFMRGGIFTGPDMLCGEPNSCVSPLFLHDLCSQAFEIPSAPHYTSYLDNRCAYWDKPYEVPCPTNTFIGTDLWYTYKAPCTGTVEFSTCDTTNFDAMLAVYGTSNTCSCPTSGTPPISCEDDSCGFQGGPPVVTRSVIAGRCYTLRVGGWEGSIGTGDLTISYLTACNPTDLNASGKTDLRDFAVFENCFGALRVGCSSSDFNHDGVIDINDYRALHAMLGL